MALHGDHMIRRPVNGQVSRLYTGFDVHGTPEDVVAFFSQAVVLAR